MVATAPSSPSSLASPSAQGRRASKIASDGRGATEVFPENDAFGRLEHHHSDRRVATTCIGRARPHRHNAHRERRRFSGHTRDGRYCRARYYHPGLGRFVSEDPAGFMGGDTNLYAYVGNNPLNWTDPWGLSRGDWWDARTYTPDLGRARVIAAEVLTETQRNFPGSRLHNDTADAWRHARWSSRMVNEIGWGTAVIAGYGHELENLYEQWGAGQPFAWEEMWMDLHNNREGRSGRDAWRLLAEGRLRITPIGNAVEYGALRYGAPGLGTSGAPPLSGRKSNGYANSSY